MLDLLLALRNLFRHRTRSAFALSAIVFGAVALLLAGGFIEWVYFAMRESVIQSRFGHIQVVRPGYFSAGAAEPRAFLLPNEAEALETIKAHPAVALVTPRLTFNGLLGRGDTTISFLGEGVDPQTEPQVSRLLTVVDGEDLAAEDAKGIILGEGLAAAAGLRPGDAVVLLAETGAGGINAVEGRVRGIFFTSTKAFDDATLRVPIEMARALTRAQGAHVWTVLLHDTEQTHVALRQLRAALPETTQGLQFVPWTELADFYNKTVELFSRQMDVVRLIIALVIVFSISNTLTMAVLERTGEIGTLMAMGSRRRAILKLFVLEGLLLGAIGGVLGLAAGVVLGYVVSAIGIPMPPPPGMARGFIGEVRVTHALAANAILIVLATSVLASLYPAWKASRLNIVDALRHNR